MNLHSTSSNQQLIVRVRRFPLRAILGIEPIWLVFTVGIIALLVFYKAIIVGLSQFIGLHPMPSYVLPLAYFALFLFCIVQIWFLVSLWRTSGKIGKPYGVVFIRIFVLVAAFFLVRGDINATDIMNHWFATTGTSVFQQ